MDVVVADQLRKVGIDVVTVRDLGTLGESDEEHLKQATEMGRVLCTQDQDFLRLAKANLEHAGIAFGVQYGATIGGWVRALRALHATTTAEAIQSEVRFLNVR